MMKGRLRSSSCRRCCCGSAVATAPLVLLASSCFWLVVLSSCQPSSTVMPLSSDHQRTTRFHNTHIMTQSSNARELQNIVITYPQDDAPPIAPTASPTSQDKYAQQVVCQSVDPNVVNATRTQIDIVYQAETNTYQNELPEDYLNEELPALVAEVAITLSADLLCHSGEGAGGSSSSSSNETISSTNTTDSGNRRRATRQLQDSSASSSTETLSECILVVSTGPIGVLQANCTPTLEESRSCGEYADSFFVLHTEACSSDDIQSGSRALLEAGLASSTFLQAVNARSANGILVTKLTLLEDTSASGITSPLVSSSGGLTGGGITLVSLMVLVTLTLMSFLFVWRRHVNRRNRRLNDDLKSIKTSWSNPTRDGDGSYLTANFNDLARRHTKLNVHKCKSALCEVCRPNLGIVHMVQVPPSANVMNCCDLVRSDTMESWDNVSSLANPDSISAGPQEKNHSNKYQARHNEPLELEPFERADFDELALDGGDNDDFIISIQEVEEEVSIRGGGGSGGGSSDEASRVSYVRSSHARKAEPRAIKNSLFNNQVLL